ncbi:Hypothetical_protein [Hexamita inflata]|uniref:Hypothetical_protein n=1 Tax=Hexamita inflata TaxID=28002 RepID=A0AA86PYC6_9EUKA|nr:Hypothetical protein HINF_LOCUS35961 [Hexamita inflata]
MPEIRKSGLGSEQPPFNRDEPQPHFNRENTVLYLVIIFQILVRSTHNVLVERLVRLIISAMNNCMLQTLTISSFNEVSTNVSQFQLYISERNGIKYNSDKQNSGSGNPGFLKIFTEIANGVLSRFDYFNLFQQPTNIKK